MLIDIPYDFSSDSSSSDSSPHRPIPSPQYRHRVVMDPTEEPMDTKHPIPNPKPVSRPKSRSLTPMEVESSSDSDPAPEIQPNPSGTRSLLRSLTPMEIESNSDWESISQPLFNCSGSHYKTSSLSHPIPLYVKSGSESEHMEPTGRTRNASDSSSSESGEFVPFRSNFDRANLPRIPVSSAVPGSSSKRKEKGKARETDVARARGQTGSSGPYSAPSQTEPFVTARVPRTAFGRARRVLASPSAGRPLATVSMRADIQFFDPERRSRISTFSLPSGNLDTVRQVEDACAIGDTIVLAYDHTSDVQVSCVSLPENSRASRPVLVDLPHTPHHPRLSEPPEDPNVSRPSIPKLIRCITPGPDRRREFLTSGYDKILRKWTLDPNSLHHTRSEKILVLDRTPAVLACHRTTLLVGFGLYVQAYDLNRVSTSTMIYGEKAPTSRMSNTIQHLYFHADDHRMQVFEVDRLDTQVHVYDSRKSPKDKYGLLYDHKSDCSFGYRAEQVAGKPRRRFTKGSTKFCYFARGYEDGMICLWDYRNPKKPVATECKRETGVVHMLCMDDHLVAFGGDSLTFMDFSLNVLSAR
ncbi:hypothetical protein D9758_015141 [Tetrapyrgos nigripes]|uniref:Uncharacterized protein n=1 Tax=Tetrapyrgos nigripes TaxID=182062 RepID=A0A8H5CQN4_9AGAR|nr:hypothetical protein D9758_015141 [Tetrapyrgos nigripes]